MKVICTILAAIVLAWMIFVGWLTKRDDDDNWPGGAVVTP